SRHAPGGAEATVHQARPERGGRGSGPASGGVRGVRRLMASRGEPVVTDPLPRPALDGHTHLDIMGLPVPGVLAAARAAGITRVVTVGTDLESSRWSATCAGQYDEVYAAVAIHPNETEAAAAGADGADRTDEVLAEIEYLAGLPQVR